MEQKKTIHLNLTPRDVINIESIKQNWLETRGINATYPQIIKELLGREFLRIQQEQN